MCRFGSHPSIRAFHRAEYHPNAGCLRANGRNPAKAEGSEFANVRIFEAETKRMPVFVLHELAHAYHDLVLGFDHPEINAAFERVVKEKSYDAVERKSTNGKPNRVERAYAITNQKEYFAETSKAYFGQNDFSLQSRTIPKWSSCWKSYGGLSPTSTKVKSATEAECLEIAR
jgi:hypothetical protein